MAKRSTTTGLLTSASGGLDRRDFLVLSGAAALAAGAPHFAGAQGNAKSVTLFLGTTPDYANIYVARDKGFLKEQGLDLDVRLFPSGSAATDGFRSGKVEFVACGEIPGMRLWQAMGARIVAPTGYDGYTPIFMTKASITQPEHLVGKTIATRIGSSAELFAKLVREKFGLDKSAFKLINLEPTDMVAVLDRGDIDGFLWYSPFEERSMKISGDKVRLFLRGEEVGSTNEVVMLTRSDIIESDPDLVIRFLRGLVKGSDYAMQNRDETVDIVAKALKLDKAAAEVTRKMQFPVRFDKRLYERYRQSSDFMVEMNFSKEPIDFEKCFWTGGLAAVDPSRVEKRPV